VLCEAFKNLQKFFATLRGGLIIGHPPSKQVFVDIKICSVAKC